VEGARVSVGNTINWEHRKQQKGTNGWEQTEEREEGRKRGRRKFRFLLAVVDIGIGEKNGRSSQRNTFAFSKHDEVLIRASAYSETKSKKKLSEAKLEKEEEGSAGERGEGIFFDQYMMMASSLHRF
jgi:hypothetical protein